MNVSRMRVYFDYNATSPLAEDVTDDEAKTITRQYTVAPVGSVVAIAISFVSGLASVTVVLIIAAFYAITGSHGD